MAEARCITGPFLFPAAHGAKMTTACLRPPRPTPETNLGGYAPCSPMPYTQSKPIVFYVNNLHKKAPILTYTLHIDVT